MVYLIALLAGTSVALAVLAVAELVPRRPRAISRELGRLEERRRRQHGGAAPRERRDARERLVTVLRQLGTPLQGKDGGSQSVRQLLVHAGYRGADALTVFWGARFALTGGLLAAAVLVAGLVGLAAAPTALAALWAAALGWCAPPVFLRRQIRRRKRELIRYLPDALDLLVICVEAGLGLNQAIARMAEEIRHFSPITAGEFAQVNLEIRAGAPRQEALRALGTRSDLPELRSLASMLVQTDRFGTSIAQALRVHSEGLRRQWQQRMEEAAAKTTVKLIFPLVLCILPVLFMIILGPVMIRMLRAIAEM